MNRHLRYCISLILLLFLFFPRQTFALAKFNTSYQIYYLVSDSGLTHVKFVINQQNNLSVVYATDYGLSINQTKLENVKVLDEGTPIVPDVLKSLNQTSISFPFTSKVVGKDKNHTFIIEYDTPDIATKFGSTWQIDIPRLEPDETIVDQAVVLTVPNSFPAPAYIDPKPDLVSQNIYYFSGKKIGNKSISAIFGTTQYYQGQINYHLANKNAFTIQSEIALPPDTSYQTVYYTQINPRPLSVRRDSDGNFLAGYLLKPSEKLDIVVDLYLKLNFQPRSTNLQPSDNLLLANSIWNYQHNLFSNPEVKNLLTPKSIYDFTVDKMKYDYEKLIREKPSRTPAAESLINYQSAICTNFTDVFVALARKAHIPARELEGFAISGNTDLKPLSLTQDILHSWPEYFDVNKSTWIQIDPTWANTTRGLDYFHKLDFNHLVFVIHGENPESPVPAGGYKNDLPTKDLSFSPVPAIDFPTANINFQFIKVSGNNLILNAVNNTGVTYYGHLVSDENPYIEKGDLWLNLAPFGSENFELHLKKKPFINKIETRVIIYLDGQPYNIGIPLGAASIQIGFYATGGVILGSLAIWTWYLHFRKSKQKTTLYR